MLLGGKLYLVVSSCVSSTCGYSVTRSASIDVSDGREDGVTFVDSFRGSLDKDGCGLDEDCTIVLEGISVALPTCSFWSV